MSGDRPLRAKLGEKVPRTSQVIAALGLVFATGLAVGGLVYAIVLDGSTTAEATLGNVSLAGVSGLLVLAGVRQSDSDD